MLEIYQHRVHSHIFYISLQGELTEDYFAYVYGHFRFLKRSVSNMIYIFEFDHVTVKNEQVLVTAGHFAQKQMSRTKMNYMIGLSEKQKFFVVNTIYDLVADQQNKYVMKENITDVEYDLNINIPDDFVMLDRI